MTGAINSSLITDPQDLQYISDVVNQVLDSSHELGSIKGVQTALKQLSLERGREIQINLVSAQNLLYGFNFSCEALQFASLKLLRTILTNEGGFIHPRSFPSQQPTPPPSSDDFGLT